MDFFAGFFLGVLASFISASVLIIVGSLAAGRKKLKPGQNPDGSFDEEEPSSGFTAEQLYEANRLLAEPDDDDWINDPEWWKKR